MNDIAHQATSAFVIGRKLLVYNDNCDEDGDGEDGGAEKRQGGKYRPATDAISDAAADVDDYYHHSDYDDDNDEGDDDDNDYEKKS